MSFLAELRRRNVIRMAGLYLVGAWLIVQVASTVFPAFELPTWALRGVILLLAIGFIPALIVAWVFELTPEGLKRDAEVDPAVSIAPQTGQRMDRMIVVGLVVVIALMAVERLWFAQTGVPAAATQANGDAPVSVNPKSIAVLAFDNMSADQDNEYFSDGVAEEILNALAQIKDLKVAGRTSSFYFKGRNETLRAIGSQLGVAHVLEGSVRKQGQRLRITAQLIRVSDGFHLWSDTFDGNDADVFALQENIAQQVTSALQVALNAGQQDRLVDAGTQNPDAYQLFLRASFTFDHRDRDHMLDAVKQLEQAVALDPSYARAYSRLAAIHAILPTYAPGYLAKRAENVGLYARRALELDPRLGEPWAAMGLSASLYGKGLIEARESFEKAVQLDPDDVTSNFWFGLTLARTGYPRAAVERIERVLAIDPMVPNVVRWRGVFHLRNGDIDVAEQFLKRARATGLRLADRELGEIAYRRGDTALARRIWNDSSEPVLGQLSSEARAQLAIAMFGGDTADRARAADALDAYLATEPEFLPGLVPMWLAQIGYGERALELDRTRAEVDNSDFMVYVFSPAGKSLRALPEFPDYLKAKELPALWDKYGAPDMCRKTANGGWACD